MQINHPLYTLLSESSFLPPYDLDLPATLMDPEVWGHPTRGIHGEFKDPFNKHVVEYLDHESIRAFRLASTEFRNNASLISADKSWTAAKTVNKAVSIWIRFWLGQERHSLNYGTGPNYFCLNNRNIVADLNAYHENPCGQTLANLFKNPQNLRCFEMPFFCTQDAIDDWIESSCYSKNLTLSDIHDIAQKNKLTVERNESVEEFLDANHTNIKELVLSDPTPEHLFSPEEFASLPKIEKLNICECNLIGFSPENFLSLTHLSLYGTLLVTLPPSIGKLHNLEYLKLSDKHLELIPNELENLQNLKYFILENSPMKTLPNAINKLANLRILWIAESKVENLPVNLNDLPKLETIGLIDNKNLPPDSVKSIIESPGSLQELWTHVKHEIPNWGLIVSICRIAFQFGGAERTDAGPPVSDYYDHMKGALFYGPYLGSEKSWASWLYTRYIAENNPFRIVSAEDIQEVEEITLSPEDTQNLSNKRPRSEEEDPDLAPALKKQKLD